MAPSERRTTLGIVMLGIACTSTPSVAQSPAGACVKHGDHFVATFGPAPNSKAIRATTLEMEEQVKLAFYSIDRQRAEMAAGVQEPEDSLRSIAGFEATIRNYLHDKANDTLILASSGRATDVPQIGRSLSAPMSIARQDGLLGHESAAQDAQNKVVAILRTFSERFAQTCQEQDFPAEVALALERQNQLVGTGISLEHCANRLVTADFDDRGIHYHFERCTLDGTGKWGVKLTGVISGSGNGYFADVGDGQGVGGWEVRKTNLGISVSGEVELTKSLIEETVKPASAPQDAGPNAKPNSCIAASVAAPPVTQKHAVLSLRTSTIHTENRMYTNDPGKWVVTEVKRSEKPCPPR